jgi:hypothetical protein
VILNQIVKNEPFENCVYKKLRFEKAEMLIQIEGNEIHF